MAAPLWSPLDVAVIQPYGCINGSRAERRPRLCRIGGCHPARHRPAGTRRPRGRRRAGRALPDELCGGAEARCRARARRPGHQGTHGPPQGRAHQHRGAPAGSRPARPVRGAVARPRRAHDQPHHQQRGDRRMTVTALRKDPDALTMTLTAEFDASPTRVWELWADPRQLERWWGPPTYPATFTAHDLAPGSRVEYHMTGPGGDQPRGFWDILEADPPRRLAYRHGFAHDDGTPNPDLPGMTAHVTIESIDAGRTRMSIESRFPSTEAMQQLLTMGMEEGLTQAVGQID